MTTFDWTTENERRLRTLWAEGLTGTEIAIALGAPSRSAILGKADRLRLGKRKSVTPWSPAHVEGLRAAHGDGISYAKIADDMGRTIASVRRKAHEMGLRVFTRPPPRPALVEYISKEDPAAPAPLNIPLIDLRDFHCRQVTSPPDGSTMAVFCGHPKARGSYCAYHYNQNHEFKNGRTRGKAEGQSGRAPYRKISVLTGLHRVSRAA